LAKYLRLCWSTVMTAIPISPITVMDPKRRTSELGHLLEPVLNVGALALGFRGVVIARRSSSGTEEIVVSAPGKSRSETYREWRFSTRAEQIQGQYFEEWANVGARRWELKHVCFHLFLVRSRFTPPEEIIAVHSEPSEDGLTLSSRLKKGPHLHVKAAGDPIGGAHFPLCLPCLNPVLNSIESLTGVMSELIGVLALEVVSKH
jgi:hypothetical protein